MIILSSVVGVSCIQDTSPFLGNGVIGLFLPVGNSNLIKEKTVLKVLVLW
jgi:hypothetical protein